MNDIWRDAKFVPHWGVFLIILGISVGTAFVMFLGWEQSTVTASNVTCSVKSSHPGSKLIQLDLNCDGHQMTISEPISLVYDVINKHVKVLTCDALYEDGTLHGCKFTEVDVGAH